MTTETIEREILQQVADKYRAQGYSVALHPKAAELPDFLQDFRPDLVARGASDSVVVDVKVGTESSATERYRDIAERVNHEPGWRFSLVYVNPDRPDEAWENELPVIEKLTARAAKAEDLLRSGDSESAFLVLWSVVEGVLRHLSRRNDLAVENLPPSALIRELYSSGELSISHFKVLKDLLPTRNKLAHGFESNGVKTHAETLHNLVRDLLREIAAP